MLINLKFTDKVLNKDQLNVTYQEYLFSYYITLLHNKIIEHTSEAKLKFLKKWLSKFM